MPNDNEVTLDAGLVLEALTGESNEVKALEVLCSSNTPPPLAELCSKWTSKGVVDPPRTLTDEGRNQLNENYKRELAIQGGTVLPSSSVALVTTVNPFSRKAIVHKGGTLVQGDSRKEAFLKLDFGWLPLEEYQDFRGRQYTIDGAILKTVRSEPMLYDTATFVSALIQFRARVPSHLELLIFSDPIVRAPDETTTIKAVFVFTRYMHETALNRPQWLVEILDQEFHKVTRTCRIPKKLPTNIFHRLTRDGGWQAVRKEVIELGMDDDGFPMTNETQELIGEPIRSPGYVPKS